MKKIYEWAKRTLAKIYKLLRTWLINWRAGGILLILFLSIIVYRFWQSGIVENNANNVDKIRIIILASGLLIGAYLAIWRGFVAEQQVEKATEQVEKATEQLEAAARSLRNDRFYRAANMLGNSALALRLVGLSALQNLAKEDPETYHLQIIEVLCAFVRCPTKDEDLDKQLTCRPDVKKAVQIIGKRSDEGRKIEKKTLREQLRVPYRFGSLLSLRKANLAGANLSDIDLSGINLNGADFSGARLGGVDFSGSSLSDANLSGAHLSFVNLSRCRLGNANLSGARLSYIDELTQEQLDQARAYKDQIPNISSSRCPHTKAPLKWAGREMEPREETNKTPPPAK
ncbi:MAG: pentapeptide repeat-containing protein [Rhodobacteraceae bacterium]|nr:pentapeptide repeat-containing protein [Paracoccaceae bacterium]